MSYMKESKWEGHHVNWYACRAFNFNSFDFSHPPHIPTPLPAPPPSPSTYIHSLTCSTPINVPYHSPTQPFLPLSSTVHILHPHVPTSTVHIAPSHTHLHCSCCTLTYPPPLFMLHPHIPTSTVHIALYPHIPTYAVHIAPSYPHPPLLFISHPHIPTPTSTVHVAPSHTHTHLHCSCCTLTYPHPPVLSMLHPHIPTPTTSSPGSSSLSALLW